MIFDTEARERGREPGPAPWAAALLVLLLLAAACTGNAPSGAGGPAPSGSTTTDPAPTAADSAAEGTPTPTQEASETTGESMPIRIVLEGRELRGTLDDTPAGRDFASLLPLTLQLTDFHGAEKIADLPRRLSSDDQIPAGTPGAPGDMTVYAPWGNLAIFYRDLTYSDDLFRVGRLESGAAEVLAELTDSTTITIETVA
jgi:hypothetical protein